MTGLTCSSYPLAQAFRWSARGISTIAAGFWLLILLDIVACDALVGFVCVNRELILLVSLVAVSILCVIIAWREEIIGGFAMVIWGLILSVFAAVDSATNGTLSVLISGVPFLIAGLLFLASSILRRTPLTNA